jgi:hypothetical protein
MTIKISKDYSETPGARYISEGPYSGEEFRETLLKPKFIKAKDAGEKLTIDFDGGYGYPTSFLEEAFGGLAREYGTREVENILCFVSFDEPALIDEVLSYIREAR